MNDPTASFDDLPAGARVARLRPLAEQALERYDLPSPRIEPIHNDWNCVFRVDAEDGSRRAPREPARSPHPTRGSGRDGLARRDRRRGLGGGACAARGPRRIARRRGKSRGCAEPRTCAVFEWVEGEQLAEEMTEPNLEALGEVAARLHAQSVGFRPPAGMKVGFALPVPRAW